MAASLLDVALSSERLVVSTAGRHATEEWKAIVQRKTADIARVGHTLWLLNAHNARPNMVQEFCRSFAAKYVVFLTRASNVSPGGVADKGTSSLHVAEAYSADSENWIGLAESLSPVTGRINRATTGLCLDLLEETAERSIDLSAFVLHPDGRVLSGFKQSDPAYLVSRVGTIRSGKYRVLAVGRLSDPYAVWLRAGKH